MALTTKQASTSTLYHVRTYDVFLSFRGQDTRNNFTAHLYSALTTKGIKAYKDDKELDRGKEINPSIWKAIEESRFSVVVLSRNYASSPWCLGELARIMSCMEVNGHIVLPVFYHVDPAEVAEQTGYYEAAFREYEGEDHEKVKTWRQCLAQVANLSGWDTRDRNESEVIEEIVKRIMVEMSFTFQSTVNDLVGINYHLQFIDWILGECQTSICSIGIWGMAGIGKTTIARQIYNRDHCEFEGSCFLANVREVFQKYGPLTLQNQLLSDIFMERDVNVSDPYKGRIEIMNRLRHKRVLVVLDDVDKFEQLEMLAKEKCWFGHGSRIVITSRNLRLIRRFAVDGVYNVDTLDDDQSLTLFSLNAFQQEQPRPEFLELSRFIVNYANGLPLALKILGLFLHGRRKHEWESAIARLNEIPNTEILDVLKLSFNGLEESEQNIFLDVACFFKGKQANQVTSILNGCGFHADIGLQVLIDKGLVYILGNNLWMHDLLQMMGQQLVRLESPKEPGNRSRLWAYEDIRKVFIQENGSANVEGIVLYSSQDEQTKWKAKAFLKMSKLRYLEICNVQFSAGPKHLSNELRFLCWNNYPSKSLPSSFQPDELLELHLQYSSIKFLWVGIKKLDKLKEMNLGYSRSLIRTPDFSGIQNLEKLILDGCTSLCEVHPSFGCLKKLSYASFSGCSRLKNLPKQLEMDSLQHLDFSYCSRLEKFPNIPRNMERLKNLNLDGSGIKELPSSIERLLGLQFLSLNKCRSLETLPSSMTSLKSLKRVDLSGYSELRRKGFWSSTVRDYVPLAWTKLVKDPAFANESSEYIQKNRMVRSVLWGRSKKLIPCATTNTTILMQRAVKVFPQELCDLSALKYLYLKGNDFRFLPTSIKRLSNLLELRLENCKMLMGLHVLPPNIIFLNVNGCTSFMEMPDPIVLSTWRPSKFSFLNCLKFLERSHELVEEILQRYIQGPSFPRPRFDVIIPGREIPRWFSHQNESSSTSLVTPPGLLSNAEWMGYAVCVAFRAANIPNSEFGIINLVCRIIIDGRSQSCWPCFPIEMNFGRIEEDHLWAFYLSPGFFPEWDPMHFSHIEFSFDACSAEVSVLKCGARLVFRTDIAENEKSCRFVTVQSLEHQPLRPILTKLPPCLSII